MKDDAYVEYPITTVLAANALSYGIAAAGALILLRFGALWASLYVLFFLTLEIRLMRRSCPRCAYYGRRCFSGHGLVAPMLFKKRKEGLGTLCLTWKDMMPDIAVSFVPILAGIYLLLTRFDWSVLALVLFIVVLTTAGNGYVRMTLACPHCRQRKTCPALRLFQKPQKKK